jgi:preprotein translocase subunit SecE
VFVAGASEVPAPLTRWTGEAGANPATAANTPKGMRPPMAMNMNREQKRMLKRAGYLGEDGEPATRQRTAPAQVSPGRDRERTSPRQFLREMRGELRKVAWPSKAEVINYSVICLIFLVFITALVGIVDWGFAKSIFWLFGIK